MCGRFTLTASGEELAEAFDLDGVPVLEPRYNIAPGQDVPVIALASGRARRLGALRWGVRPAKGGRPVINVRSETAARSPVFRDAFRRRRCALPADGFYEWEAGAADRRPFYFRRPDRRAFLIAGLWQPPAEGRPLGTVAVLTTAAEPPVRAVHGRMPLVLDPAGLGAWLDPATPAPESLLAPCAAASPLEATRVSTAVNDARVDGPACILPG